MIGGYTAPRQSRTEAGTLVVGYHQGGVLLFAGKLDTSSDQNLLRDQGARRRVTWKEPELVAQSRVDRVDQPRASMRTPGSSVRAT